jgi:polysaccharide biosynthesis protein PslH
MRMKILQLTNKIPYPPKDGGAIATLNLSRGLAQLGHDVDILGMNTSKHYTDLEKLPAELTRLIQFFDVKIDTGINFMAAFKNLLFSKYPYNAERFFSESFSQALIARLKEKKYDVIQLEGLYLAYYIDVIRQNSDALIALRAHNIEHEIWERATMQEKSALKRWYLRKLARRIKAFKIEVLNRYDLLIPITDRDASQFASFGNNKPVQVVPVGYELSNIVPRREKISFPSVFFIGTLDWFPNQEGLLWFLEHVWSKLLERNPGLKFHIAGRNAPSWLKARFGKYANVRFFGEIENAFDFMNSHAIMIAPLFSGSGMRVKIIEGMAMGKTIVTTTIGAEGIDVKPGQNIIIEDNPVQFMLRIDQLIKDPVLFEKIGGNAIRFVRNHFDNQRFSQSLANFYQQQLKHAE